MVLECGSVEAVLDELDSVGLFASEEQKAVRSEALELARNGTGKASSSAPSSMVDIRPRCARSIKPRPSCSPR
jgi:hypothetical protein